MSARVPMRVRNIQCVKLSGVLGPNSARAGGKLVTRVTTEFRSTDAPFSAEGLLAISVRGVPVDANAEDEYSFAIDVKVKGRFDWDEGSNTPDMSDRSFADSQFQSLYVFGVAMVKEIGLRMGYSGINLFWDLSRHKLPSKKVESGKTTKDEELAHESSPLPKPKVARKKRAFKSEAA